MSLCSFSKLPAQRLHLECVLWKQQRREKAKAATGFLAGADRSAIGGKAVGCCRLDMDGCQTKWLCTAAAGPMPHVA